MKFSYFYLHIRMNRLNTFYNIIVTVISSSINKRYQKKQDQGRVRSDVTSSHRVV